MTNNTVGELFMSVLQHMKCIEVRMDYAKALTSQKQKYALGQAVMKTQSAINTICDLLGDSNMVLSIKKDLDRTDLVYVMLLTEKFYQLEPDELEEVDQLLEDFIIKKRAKNDKLIQERQQG